MSTTIIQQFAAEFEAEIPATRKCIERVPEKLYDWKPHERSLTMGYVVLLVTDIPRWLTIMMKTRVIDFQTYENIQPKTTSEMVNHFEKNIVDTQQAFRDLSIEDLSKTFVLKNGEQILMESPLQENISSTLNHWVHHRGQLTVYLRLNDISVPSIYGPSGDEKM
jgi:uncharacterized damage-inducible protein DinB